MTTLSSQAVMDLIQYCLFRDDEPQDNFVKAEGIVTTYGFHPGRLAEKENEIAAFLDELPVEFRHDQGGGYSFLQACQDRHGNQWTGFHKVMDQLFCLGIAIDRVEYCLPRELWQILPGGMPYLVIKSKETANAS